MTKPEKILFVMYQLSDHTSKPLLYEDIVVRAFHTFPKDFQLRGYPEYPDSSDIHKPLYAMKKRGLVRSANKSFELTQSGLEAASQLVEGEPDSQGVRLTKSEEREIRRILNSASWQLFRSDAGDKILDTDFYEYLGVSVRTSKNDFVGRLSAVSSAVESFASKEQGETAKSLTELHKFLTERFQDEIQMRR